MRNLRRSIAALALVLFAASAEATPIVGSFSISGNFLPVNGLTGALTTLGLATGIDFIDLNGSTPTPGTAGQFTVNSASLDFSGLVGQTGAIRDFSFAGAGSTSFPNVAIPLVAFQTVGGLTFTLTSMAAPLLQNNTFLALSGQGFFSMTGYADTWGTFDFSGNGSGGTFSFSASNGATSAVPEPASMALLGAGLLVCAATLNRRRRKSSV
jgi:hypothetical protein